MRDAMIVAVSHLFIEGWKPENVLDHPRMRIRGFLDGGFMNYIL